MEDINQFLMGFTNQQTSLGGPQLAAAASRSENGGEDVDEEDIDWGFLGFSLKIQGKIPRNIYQSCQF